MEGERKEMGFWKSATKFCVGRQEQVAGQFVVFQSPCVGGLCCIQLQATTGVKISRARLRKCVT